MAVIEQRPQHPHRQALHAELVRPAHEAAAAVELHQRLARVGRQRQHRAVLGGQWRHGQRPLGGGAQGLHVAVAGGARDQVQQFDVAGRFGRRAGLQGLAERTGEGGQVGCHEGQGFTGHRGSSRAWRHPRGRGAGGRRLAGRAQLA
ncbi:hypothetical protein [Rubrivivax gelatinosus]|uniref:hypothetical protein n=1 Tax=Rubrivivax gelatinosus TaxID=28068 RepID=UPI001ED8D5F0|nr:hypothetical protein [Rubrivivax gelatinosus]